MAQLILYVNIDQADLESIRAAGESLVLVRNSTNPALDLSVVWATCAPFTNNKIAWTGDYSLYAAQSSASPGATIFPVSISPAVLDTLYLFDGTFKVDSSGAVPRSSYRVRNLLPDMSFGLAQEVTTNDQPSKGFLPTVIQRIPLNQTGAFPPDNTVWAFFAGALQPGRLIRTSTYLPVDYIPTAQADPPIAAVFSSSIRVGFDSSTTHTILYSGGRWIQSATRTGRPDTTDAP